jgi:ribonuclease HI
MNAVLFTDGGARGNPGPAATGAFLFDSSEKLISFTGSYLGSATNNQAEYEALILGLELAEKENVTKLECFLDSELIVKQLNGEYKVKDEKMKKLKVQVDKAINQFEIVKFTHIKRELNKHADRMVNLILDNA